MKIIVLEGYTLNPGDLDWGVLTALGDVTIYERTSDDEISERAKDADAILSNKCRLTADVFSQLQNLKYVGVLATGYDSIDVNTAIKHGITVTNVPTYGTRSVAQMTFAHILHISHKLAEHDHGVKAGKWSGVPDYCYWDYPQTELADKVFGILGMGRIGRAAAEIGEAFGMKIQYFDPVPVKSIRDRWASVSLRELFESSDILSLHCPLTPETKEIVNRDHLKLMKNTAILINTSRGGLVNSTDLAEALNKGIISAAGLDVLDKEPPPNDHPLIGIPNCFITPHIAWATQAARQRLLNTAVENLKAFMRGEKLNEIIS